MSRHDKFKTYWESIGKPQLEAKAATDNDNNAFIDFWGKPSWFESVDYRIAGDRNWKLRRKWVYSDKKLRILEMDNDGWIDAGNNPNWWQSTDYKEALWQSDEQ